VKGSSTVNARGVIRLGLLAFGLALSSAVVCDTQELLPSTNTVVTAASSIESTALTSDDGGGVIAGHIATISGTPAQYLGGGCERVRRPNCNRPGRRSTHRWIWALTSSDRGSPSDILLTTLNRRHQSRQWRLQALKSGTSVSTSGESNKNCAKTDGISQVDIGFASEWLLVRIIPVTADQGRKACETDLTAAAPDTCDNPYWPKQELGTFSRIIRPSSNNPGTFDYAVIFGNNDTALAGGDAAGGGSYDGAYVEGNALGTAHAQGGDYLADILKFYGDGSTSTTAPAAESGGHLTDLLSGGSGAAADASNLWTELLSSFASLF
jgi:hypothetical protein